MSEHLRGTAENKLARQLKNAVRLAKKKKAEKEKEIPQHNPDTQKLSWEIAQLRWERNMARSSLEFYQKNEGRAFKWIIFFLFLGIAGWALFYLSMCWGWSC